MGYKAVGRTLTETYAASYTRLFLPYIKRKSYTSTENIPAIANSAEGRQSVT